MAIPDDIQIPLFASIPPDEMKKLFAGLRRILLRPLSALFDDVTVVAIRAKPLEETAGALAATPRSHGIR
jgi:hypothetical protein